MNHHWKEIIVTTSQEAADTISNMLIELGSTGTILEDHPADSTLCSIKAYYPDSANVDELLLHIRVYLTSLEQEGISASATHVAVQIVANADWESNWKQYFRPFRVGKHLIIKPSWEILDTAPDDLVIELDPGMAFGTGLHASTRLALAFLERVVLPGNTVLDVGTGSGILSIAAAKLGAAHVLAVDNDDEAVAIARENVCKNSTIAPQIELQTGSIDTLPIAQTFDVIVMNIRPDVILSLMPYALQYLRVEGKIILAGILEKEGKELCEQLRRFPCAIQQQEIEDGWIAYVLNNDKNCISAKISENL